MQRQTRCKSKSERVPALVRHGLPWCDIHDAYAPRRYNPFCEEIHGHLIAQYLCDECYMESSRDI